MELSWGIGHRAGGKTSPSQTPSPLLARRPLPSVAGTWQDRRRPRLASVSGELHLEESFSTACSRLGREETAGGCEATVLRATLLPGQPVGPLHGCARWTFLKLARGPRPIGARVTHSPISEPGSNRYTDSHTQPHTSKPPGRPQRARVCRRRTRATSAWAEQSAVTGSRALLHPSSLLPPPPPRERSLAPWDGTSLPLRLPHP